MIAVLASLVFATAGCGGAAVIGTSIRDALPALRRLNAERGSLAEDRAYLITIIEAPRHEGALAPAPKLVARTVAAPTRVVAEPIAAAARVRRGARVRQPFIPATLPAAA